LRAVKVEPLSSSTSWAILPIYPVIGPNDAIISPAHYFRLKGLGVLGKVEKADEPRESWA
jgi:hypothetical protein